MRLFPSFYFDRAKTAHPVLRYMLGNNQSRGSCLGRLFRAGLWSFAALTLVALGYAIATDFGALALHDVHLYDMVYWPLVLLGAIAGLAAMTMTGSVIAYEKVRGTWDSLRLTTYGARLTFQARWVLVFWAMRWALLVNIAARLVLVGVILVELTQFRGRYLDLLLSGVVPDVPVWVGAILLAASMAAALLQPLVSLGLDASVGLLVSVVLRRPRYAFFVRVLLGSMRLLLVTVSVTIGTFVLEDVAAVQSGWVGLGLLAQSILGDQGLWLLHLEQNGLLWLDVPYGVMLGLVLLLFTMGQAWLAGVLVNLASRLAERVE